MKNYRLLLATACLGTLALTGCAASSSGQAPASVTVTASATPPPSTTPTPVAASASPTAQGVDMGEVRFIRALRNGEETFDSNDDEGLLVIGRGFCTMYDNGAESSDINEMILDGMGYAYTLKQLMSVHGYAVGALCPEHIDKLS